MGGGGPGADPSDGAGWGKPLTRMAGGVHNDLVKTAIFPLCLGLSSVALVSCGSWNQPLDGSYDPLSSPGSQRPGATMDVTGPQYRAGQWLETSTPNTAFFPRSPRGNDQPNKVLPASTPLKVITTEGTYVKVELEDGAIGYVPTIMVAEKPLGTQVPIVPEAPGNMVNPGAYSGRAPEPEVPPLSVEDATAVPMTDRIE